MGMNWKDISVFQWQQLNDLFIKSKNLTELDLAVQSAAICTNKTENEIDSLPLKELNSLLKQISFIHEEIKPQPQKFIQINKRRYKCIYDVRKIPAARYIETKHFGQDVNGNLHKIAACMVVPMKKSWFGWKVDKYEAARHEEYAQDMLEAPITAILGSVVFFYQVYKNWIKSSKDYLIKEMMTKMTRYQAEVVYQTLCDTMDGYTRPSWSLTSRKSHSNNVMNSRYYNTLMTWLTLKRRENTKQSS